MNKLMVPLFGVVALISAATLSFAAASPENSGVRTVQSLDDDWRFHLDAAPEATAPGYDDSAWRHVDVPHDYVIDGKFTEQNPRVIEGRDPGWYSLHAYLPVLPAVYRKAIDLPAEAKGKRLWLEFDGVCSNSHTWLNGIELGHEYSPYNRFRFDITAAARCGGPNVLVVQVDPRYDGWWYEGGGIYRHVRLVTVDPVHIAPDGVFVRSSVSNPGDGVHADATILAQTAITNTTSAATNVTVTSEILDADGRVVATATSRHELEISTSGKVEQQLTLPQAMLWSTQHPYLYRLRSTAIVGGKVVDVVITKFGVRDARFDVARGFLLNGQPVKLQGVNMHEDHAGVGVAMPDRLFTWRLERLREMGCNAIRLSHNPVTPFLLDECDRLGFLVIAENRHPGDTYIDQAPKETPAVELRDLSAMIMRDRNHPSIIAWSLCNEQWIQGTPEAGAMIRANVQRVRELDPTRPATAALNGGFDSTVGIGSVIDVIGTNYHPEVYDSVHALFPKTPLVGTEIASEIATRGIYSDERWESYRGDRKHGYISAYGVAGPGGQTAEEAWTSIATRPFFAGGFVWAGFDYKGEPRPFEWPVINCHYGFMDICGFPKDSYYYYKAWWTNEPVLHLFPHWNWAGREGQEIPVWVHSNCDEVELFLNGVSLGKQTVTPLHHLEWKVRYAPGKLVAKGVRKGVPIEATRETTGAPAAIRLTADRSALTADNADLAVVTVEVIDAQGRVVPTAGNAITFTVAGPGKLIGVGNGDPSSHEPDHAMSRSVFNGLAQAILQTTHSDGEITLGAKSPGLTSARVTLVSGGSR